MSKYTTEVRFICESAVGNMESQGYNKVDEILTQAAPMIFDFDFPIFDENYRLVLEKAILRHFYTREIAFETAGLWKLKLWDKLCLIMPYYNRLYESALLKFNPFYDVDLTTEHEGSGSGTSTSNEVVDTDRDITDGNVRWDLYSDTPQGGINGITADSDSVANNTYLTDARKITDDGSRNENVLTGREQTGTVTSLDSYTDRVFGKRGGKTYPEMLLDLRKTFLRIDEMLMGELEELFFGLW